MESYLQYFEGRINESKTTDQLSFNIFGLIEFLRSHQIDDALINDLNDIEKIEIRKSTTSFNQGIFDDAKERAKKIIYFISNPDIEYMDINLDEFKRELELPKFYKLHGSDDTIYEFINVRQEGYKIVGDVVSKTTFAGSAPVKKSFVIRYNGKHFLITDCFLGVHRELIITLDVYITLSIAPRIANNNQTESFRLVPIK